MKPIKKLCILLTVLAVASVATLIATRTEEKKENIKTTGETILAVPTGDITSLSWEYDTTSLSFHKEENIWQWDDDAAFPVNEEKIESLLSVFKEFNAAFIIDDVEDLSQYGLDKPVATIRFSTAGQDYEIALGDYSKLDSQRYVTIGDGKVYLVTTDPYDTYAITIRDMILHDETPSFDNVTGITFSGSENYSLFREEDSNATYCASDVYFTTKDGKTLPLDTYRVENYYASVSNLDLENYVSYNVTDDELAAWDLDDPEVTAVISYTVTDSYKNETDTSFTLNISRNQAELAEKEAAEAKDEEYTGTVTAYARVGDSPIVYEISESDYNTLSAVSYNDMRHREVVTADLDTMTQLDITLDAKTYTVLANMEEKADERTFTLNDEEVDIATLRNKIKALSVTEFSDEKALEKREIRLVFHLDNENYPTLTVDLYRYDGTNCIATLDGKTIGLLSRSSVVNLVEAVNAIVLG